MVCVVIVVIMVIMVIIIIGFVHVLVFQFEHLLLWVVIL